MKMGHLIEVTPGRVLLAFLAILLALCTAPAAIAAEPGVITVVVSDEPHTLDVAELAVSSVGKIITKNVVEPMTELDPEDGSVNPRLATSWKHVDPTTWQFSLRKGVKFHDGADFDAEVFLYNLKRLYSDKIVSKVRTKVFAHFTMEARALDSHTVEIRTNKLEPLLPTLMTNFIIVSPNTPIDKWTRTPIGTGPYKLARWDAGTQIVLERFPGYWGKKPQVEKAIFVWRKESAVRAAMVAMGEADLALDIAIQDANRPDLDHMYLNGETSWLRIGAWEPPLNDRRVRLALNYAVDRNLIRGTIFSKDVVPAAQLVGPGVSGFNPTLKPYPYDPEKAKKLLDEARKDGVPVDKEIVLIGRTGIYPNDREVMEAITNMYRAVGLNVKLRMLEVGVYQTFRDKPFPKDVPPYLLQNQHDNTAGDAVFTVFAKYSCKGAGSPICDEQLDQLIEKATSSTGEERKKTWQAAFKRIHEEDVPDVMMFHMVGYCRIGQRINFKPTVQLNSEVQIANMTFR